MAAEKMKADPSRTLVIEDSVVGVTAGVAAEMTTWGFSGIHHSPAAQAQTLSAAGASHVFHSLKALLQSLTDIV